MRRRIEIIAFDFVEHFDKLTGLRWARAASAVNNNNNKM